MLGKVLSKEIESLNNERESLNNDNMGTFTDARDGQTYKTVKIGSQIWMAENLNYKFAETYCPDGNPDNREKFGLLYTWKAAKVACPDGWHIPSKEEWDELEKFVADSLFRGEKDFVGYALKSKGGWEDDDEPGNGTDAVGFGALPAGYRKGDGTFRNVFRTAEFWSSTESRTFGAYFRELGCDGTVLGTDDYDKNFALSVRCVKD